MTTDTYEAIPPRILAATPSGRQAWVEFSWGEIKQIVSTLCDARWQGIYMEHKCSNIATDELWKKVHAKCSFQDFCEALGRLHNAVDTEMADRAQARAKLMV